MSDLSHLDTWHQSTFKPKTRRSGDHEEISLGSSPDRRLYAAIECLRPPGCSGTPIDLIHNPPLGGRWNGGHGEVRVATQVSQKLDLSGQSAVEPVGAGVIQRPVSMNKAEDHAPPVIVQKAVIVPKPSTEVTDLSNKAFCRLLVVVDVNFDITDSLPRHLREWIEQLCPVFLLRIEEAVTGHATRGISGGSAGNPRPHLLPAGDTLQRRFDRCLLTQRLIMIGDANPQPFWCRSSQQMPGTITEIARKP